jgi:hypothetical protein
VATTYDQAAEALYQGPHESFVAKRQELAAELKGAGDKASAARLAKLPRPSISAWAVNQLWWHARSAFNDLFETAEQVRAGKAPAGGAHRQAVSKLTVRAKQLLEAHEHGSNEATLRRITMTLSALAASGSWDPEQPGMLSKDLDPPGFEAFGMTAAAPSKPEPEPEPRTHASKPEPETKSAHGKANKRAEAEAKAREEAEAKHTRELERASAAAEKKRLAEQRIEHAAKKTELESALRAAKTAVTEQERERDRAAKALKSAEHEVERALAKVEAAEAELSEHSTR